MNYFGKIAKQTLLFAAVGALLAVAAGPLLVPAAQYLGLGANMAASIAAGPAASAAWGAVFFGAFGAIETALEPLFNLFSGKTSYANNHTVMRSTNHSQAPSISPELSKESELSTASTVSFGSDGTVLHKPAAPGKDIQLPAALLDKVVAVQQERAV